MKYISWAFFIFSIQGSSAFALDPYVNDPRVIVTECFNNGVTALREKAFDRAEEQLSCALVNAREYLDKADFITKKFSTTINQEKLVEILHYYALANENLCRWPDAESALIDGVNESKKLTGSYPRELPSLIQLAQFYFDRGEYEKSLAVYDETRKSGEAFFIKNDPIGYALLLEDQSTALEKSNKSDLAKISKEKASKLRQEYSDKKPILLKEKGTYIPIPENCK